MLKRLAERSLAIIVHNPAAARIVRSHAPNAAVIEIPFLYTDPPQVEPQRLAPFVFGIFGYVRESKRVTTALRAFQRVRGARSSTAFLLAGQFVSSDLARTVSPLLSQPGVIGDTKGGITADHCPAQELDRRESAIAMGSVRVKVVERHMSSQGRPWPAA